MASQLLSDRSGQGSFKPASTCDANLDVVLKQAAYGNASASVIGASVAALCAFGMAWIVRWAGNVQSRSFGKGRIALAVSAFVAVAILFYAYARQRWLQHLRRQAVDAASALVTNALAFDASTHSALTLIQEVELVSRGYRMYVQILLVSGNITLTETTEVAPYRQSHASRKRIRSNDVPGSDENSKRHMPRRCLHLPRHAAWFGNWSNKKTI